jgi:RNA polymerase sigma factor (sigma-70 family)
MGVVDHNSHRIRSHDSQITSDDAKLPHQSGDVQRDLDLVRRLLARDEKAWMQFVSQYRRLLLQRICAVAGELNIASPSADMVEEVCAEIFSTLIGRDMCSLRQFKGNSRLSTWLAVVARRTAMKMLGRARRQPRQPDTAELDMLSADDVSTAIDENQQLDRALQQLSGADQRLLHLFYHRHFTYEQLAAEFAVTVNAVGPKLDRARRRLKKQMEKIQRTTAEQTTGH